MGRFNSRDGRMDVAGCGNPHLSCARNAVAGARLLERGNRALAASRGCARQRRFLGSATAADRITVKTAVLMTLRNEDPARALLRLKTVKVSLDKTGEGAELFLFRAERHGPCRRGAPRRGGRCGVADGGWRSPRAFFIAAARTTPVSKPATCATSAMRWGSDFALMLPLDADSLMTGHGDRRACAHYADASQARHPAEHRRRHAVRSAFARIFQFGMRLGMRTYTMGQAWWVGRLRAFLGAQCAGAHQAVRRALHAAGACRASRRSAAKCFRTIRSKRR